MTSGILTKMVGLDSSHQVWHKLQTHYASQTRAQIKKHKQLLRTPKKDRSVSAYLLEIKKTVDTLAIVGCPISTEDHIEVVLDGFQWIRFCRNTCPLFHLPSPNQTTILPNLSLQPIPLVLVNKDFLPRHVFQTPRTTTSCHLIPFSSRVQCQICGKYGHTALHCWHRFDSSTPSQVNANSTHFSSPLSDDEPSILGTQLLHDPLWYPDSGASHHLTSHSTNLSTKTPYIGSEKVAIGNGSRLHITFIGIATYTDLNTHNTFSLQHLLHVPTISKNL